MVQRGGGCVIDLAEEARLRCSIDLDECDCGCHRDGGVHCMPCCEQCSYCEKNIVLGRVEAHRAICWQKPSILNSFIRREAERAELLRKAIAVVGRLGYSAILSDQMIGEGEDARCLVAITIDTKGTFPGTLVLSQLTDELAKTLSISFEQVNFCLFHQPKPEAEQ